MKNIQYRKPPITPLVLADPGVLYASTDRLHTFAIPQFEALSKKLAFTQQEWADILHISERTLQRYVKDGKAFDGLHAEHLHQLRILADEGLAIFKTAKAFEVWLREPKQILGKTIDFSALQSFGGTKLISDELGRMAHGVYI